MTSWNTLKDKSIDAVILDGGSPDSGPGRLAQGKSNVPFVRLERDLATLVQACHLFHVPIFVGSMGGDSENAHVDWAVKVISELVQKNGYRPMKVIGIHLEILKEHVYEKMEAGLIEPCGEGVPELTKHDIESSTRIVAQMGYLKAMQDNSGFDIILGGRTYDPAPFAAFCLYKGFTNMGRCWKLPSARAAILGLLKI